MYSQLATLTIGVTGQPSLREDISMLPLGEMEFVFVVSPHHPLAKKTDIISTEEIRSFCIIAVADTARNITSRSSGILPGQSIFTVSTFHEKIEALCNSLGVGYLPLSIARPLIKNGQLISKKVKKKPKGILSTAWRTGAPGKALHWFIEKLSDEQICKKILSG